VWIVVMRVCIVVSFVILVLMFLVSLRWEVNENAETAYECGFDSRSLARQRFSLRFFLIAILFLIFDVEISLMLPVPLLMFRGVSSGVFLVFCVVLLVGLVYELRWGSLDWVD
jgi:NADH-ubiquinone oxidoreductase chain 3